MNKYSSIQNYRDLIGLSIEKTLAEIGLSVLYSVQDRLLKEYNCKFSDCLDHPDYLNKILRDIFGNSYYVIVDSIQQNLKEFSTKDLVVNFIRNIQTK